MRGWISNMSCMFSAIENRHIGSTMYTEWCISIRSIPMRGQGAGTRDKGMRTLREAGLERVGSRIPKVVGTRRKRKPVATSRGGNHRGREGNWEKRGRKAGSLDPIPVRPSIMYSVHRSSFVLYVLQSHIFPCVLWDHTHSLKGYHLGFILRAQPWESNKSATHLKLTTWPGSFFTAGGRADHWKWTL